MVAELKYSGKQFPLDIAHVTDIKSSQSFIELNNLKWKQNTLQQSFQ